MSRFDKHRLEVFNVNYSTYRTLNEQFGIGLIIMFFARLNIIIYYNNCIEFN